MNDQKPKKKKWKLFDSNRDGPGVEKGEDTRPTLKYFFKQVKRKFWKLVSINLMMLFQVIPLLLMAWVYTLGPTTPYITDTVYPALLGAQTAQGTTAGATMFNTLLNLDMLPALNSPVIWIIGAIAIVYVATFGLQQVGTTYLIRNLMRGDAVFVVSDYFYAIKRDWKRGMILGVIDCVLLGLLLFNISPFNNTTGGFFDFVFMANVAIFIIYFIMRFYTYLLLVTFDMKIFKIFKHALIFTVLGIKRNILAVLGIVLLVGISVFLALTTMSFLPVFIILPFLYLLALCSFMATYAAYPVIKKYMIDPVPVKETDVTDEETDETNE